MSDADNSYRGKMQTGITFTIEPVLAQGSHEIIIQGDGWTAVTLDIGRAEQCEHTVLITVCLQEMYGDQFSKQICVMYIFSKL